MQKSKQLEINKVVIYNTEIFEREYCVFGSYKEERLYTCNAQIVHTTNYIALRSYNTIVAVYDRDTGILYDYLRYVYGYTATSAQHISKFRKLMNCRADNVLTYREV